MTNFKFLTGFFSIVVLTAFMLPVFAQVYNPGVTAGQYVKYGNFVGIGAGVELFNDYDWSKLEITSISGKEVTLLTTGQFKNGNQIPGNGTTKVWNVEAGTEDGISSTQGPIIAANLNQGDAIPPPKTYSVNKTETRIYLGNSRSVNILDVTIATPDYDTTLIYVYDRLSGMLLEASSETRTLAQPEPDTSEYSYRIIETNIFGSASTTLTALPIEYIVLAFAIIVIIAVAITLVLRKRA